MILGKFFYILSTLGRKKLQREFILIGKKLHKWSTQFSTPQSKWDTEIALYHPYQHLF